MSTCIMEPTKSASDSHWDVLRAPSASASWERQRGDFVSAPESIREIPVTRFGRVSVLNEEFDLELEGTTYYLAHPVWSLVGAGPTVEKALEDLLREASEVVDDLEDVPEQDLSDEAHSLLGYSTYLVAVGV